MAVVEEALSRKPALLQLTDALARREMKLAMDWLHHCERAGAARIGLGEVSGTVRA